MTQKGILYSAFGTGLILLVPLLGNMFADGWHWSLGDFVIMGALLFLTGLALSFASTKIVSPAPRLLACAIIVFICIAIWAQLAVGAISQVMMLLF